MIVALKLILAHLIGDFGLQFKSWVRHKEKHQLKSGILYLHVVIHGVFTLLLLWPEINADISYLWIPVIVLITHFIIDGAKLVIQDRLRRKNGPMKGGWRQFFYLADQFLHLLILGVLWFVFEIGDLAVLTEFLNEKHLLLLVCVFFLTQPATITVMILISGWFPNNEGKDHKTLANAGKYIGILERLFIFGFIVTNNWSGIGFLLAAKSVFRFGDLKDKDGIKLTEYILIGTLISFGIAILVSVIYLKLLSLL